MTEEHVATNIRVSASARRCGPPAPPHNHPGKKFDTATGNIIKTEPAITARPEDRQ
jgi:hypothetical protein